MKKKQSTQTLFNLIESSPTKKQNKNVNKQTSNWIKLCENKPEYEIPCEFYLGKSSKKVGYGYFINGGFVSDCPYEICKVKRIERTVLYRYVDIKKCTSYMNCPNGFPNCSNCKNR